MMNVLDCTCSASQPLVWNCTEMCHCMHYVCGCVVWRVSAFISYLVVILEGGIFTNLYLPFSLFISFSLSLLFTCWIVHSKSHTYISFHFWTRMNAIYRFITVWILKSCYICCCLTVAYSIFFSPCFCCVVAVDGRPVQTITHSSDLRYTKEMQRWQI